MTLSSHLTHYVNNNGRCRRHEENVEILKRDFLIDAHGCYQNKKHISTRRGEGYRLI